jgi:hypothetical protein
MRKATLLVVSLVLGLVAGAVLAANPSTVADVTTRQIYNFRRGLRVGTASNASGVTNITRGSLDYDFPSLGGFAGGTTVCAESIAATVTGARLGDPCTVGVDQALVNAFGTISAYVSASDTAKIRACGQGITDGGSFNQPDSGYSVLCFGPAP